MLGTEIKPNFLPRDYDIFAGFDVDKKHIDITFSDHDQNMKSVKIPHSADHLLNYTLRHFHGKRVAFAYEAGPTGFNLFDRINASGQPCLVLAPSMVPTAAGQRVKTNRLDSRKISTALRGGQLRSIHVPSLPYRHLRHLVQLRDTFVRQSVAFQVRIKAFLLLENIAFPDRQGRWTAGALAQLQGLSCPPAIRFKLDQLLNSFLFAQEQISQTVREILRFCQDHPELRRNLAFVMSVPGIGRITATHLLARVGDWRLIRSSRQLSGFIGVVPCENSTGDEVNRGSITRSGDRRLRVKLIQAAWTAIRQDPELRDFYLRLYHQNPRPVAAQKAIVGVANKLCKRIACILKEQRPYVIRGTSPRDVERGNSGAPGNDSK